MNVYTRVCMCVCVPAHIHCALEGVEVFSFNVTAENISVQVTATTSCQASSSVGFGIISGHKFISTVGIWG